MQNILEKESLHSLFLQSIFVSGNYFHLQDHSHLLNKT